MRARARERGLDEPGGRQPPVAGTRSSVGDVDRRRRARPPPRRRPSARAPGREAAVGEQQQRGSRSCRLVIRTGSSAGPSAARRPGARSTSSPSMRTANVSGSTAIAGSASFSGRSALPSERVSATGTSRAPNAEPVGEAVVERRRRHEGDAGRRRATAGAAPNIGRGSTGCGVGIDALASPICAHAIIPPFTTTCGRTPKNAGSHSTRSASLPTSTEPTSRVEAVGDRRADRVLGDVAAGPVVVGRAVAGQRAAPRASSRARSARCAGPPRRRGPSPGSREPIIEIAPRSWRTSSAAIVDGRMRLSANARSSGIVGLRWWHTISMSRCSASVLTVCGRVGLVDDGSTLGCDDDGDDVGRVAAARALGVVRVDRPAGDGGERRLARSRPR